jgi:hypothetical protein
MVSGLLLRTYLMYLNKKLDNDERVAFETSDAAVQHSAWHMSLWSRLRRGGKASGIFARPQDLEQTLRRS